MYREHESPQKAPDTIKEREDLWEEVEPGLSPKGCVVMMNA